MPNFRFKFKYLSQLEEIFIIRILDSKSKTAAETTVSIFNILRNATSNKHIYSKNILSLPIGESGVWQIKDNKGENRNRHRK